MLFTEPLDIATPAGGSAVSQGDDAIRQLKRALRERLATLVVDVDANPLVLKGAAVTDAVEAPATPEATPVPIIQKTGLRQVIPGAGANFPRFTTDFNPAEKVAILDNDKGRIIGQNISQGFVAFYPIILPMKVTVGGVVLKRYQLSCQKTASNVTLNMQLIQLATGAGGEEVANMQAVINKSTLGPGLLDSGIVTINTFPEDAMFLRVTVGPAAINTVWISRLIIDYDYI